MWRRRIRCATGDPTLPTTPFKSRPFVVHRMRWTKLLTVLAVLVVAFVTVGGLLRLTDVVGESAATATLAVVVGFLAVGVLAGSRDRGGRTTYW